MIAHFVVCCLSSPPRPNRFGKHELRAKREPMHRTTRVLQNEPTKDSHDVLFVRSIQSERHLLYTVALAMQKPPQKNHKFPPTIMHKRARRAAGNKIIHAAVSALPPGNPFVEWPTDGPDPAHVPNRLSAMVCLFTNHIVHIEEPWTTNKSSVAHQNAGHKPL